MSDDPKGKKRWLPGVIRACVLALVCVCTAAKFVEARDGHWLIHNRWPHLDPLFAPLVLGPAVAFWCYCFTYHWRGRAFLAELAAVTIAKPRFWCILALAVVLFWLLMMEPAVRSAA